METPVVFNGSHFYASNNGGAAVGLPTLPKLISKSLGVKSLKKEIYEPKKGAGELEKRQEETE